MGEITVANNFLAMPEFLKPIKETWKFNQKWVIKFLKYLHCWIRVFRPEFLHRLSVKGHPPRQSAVHDIFHGLHRVRKRRLHHIRPQAPPKGGCDDKRGEIPSTDDNSDKSFSQLLSFQTIKRKHTLLPKPFPHESAL